ncbi:MAG: 2,3-diphosphoglycerate-dependent phosphoglycerate mutase [Alphaproteobacteria bacterium]|nr:2,3-diphosphoglycerate-dependent phosphoglycerate mutase [Alphaproteobacteria bacterium]
MSTEVQTEIDLSEQFHYAVFLRHGESVMNKQNRFTGWMNPDLTEQGVEEAVLAGKLLKKLDIQFDEVHSSVLTRANLTALLALTEAGQEEVLKTMARTKALNERHYGALQGLNKAETAEKHGDEQVAIWRRSYDIAPPADDEGMTESLKDVVEKRTGPYIKDSVIPQIRQGKNVAVIAHGNSNRAALIALGLRDDNTIFQTELETGVPLVFKFNQANELVDAFFLKEEGPEPFELPHKPFIIPGMHAGQ